MPCNVCTQGSCQLVTEVPRERPRPHTSVGRRAPDLATQFPEMFRKQEHIKQQRASMSSSAISRKQVYKLLNIIKCNMP